MQRYRILVAVKPPSLFRVIEHILCHPAADIVPYAGPDHLLAQCARTANPDLIIIASNFFDSGGLAKANDLKFSNPRSRLIVIGSFEELHEPVEVRGADALLCDEALVEQLPQAVWNLLGRETFQQ